VKTLALLACSLLLFADTLEAQIAPCSGVQDPGTKILLDEIVASTPGAANLLQPLASRLDAGLLQVQTELGLDLNLKVLPCVNRKPTGPADFTRSVVDQLNVRNVVMEVWGVTTEVKDAQGRAVQEASVGYVLVPVRLNELQSQRPPGAFVIPYRARPSDPAADLLRLVDQSGRLAAYAMLAAGSRALRAAQDAAAGRRPRNTAEDDWAVARKRLCAAQALFTSLKPPPAASDMQLVDYTRTLAAQTITGAKADQRYSGSLKLQPENLPCPTGR
jgi:hypothetical protein